MFFEHEQKFLICKYKPPVTVFNFEKLVKQNQ